MSSKFNLLNRFRSKSFDKSLNTITHTYQYIENFDNFDNITEEECIKMDNINREIYKKNMELFDDIVKKIGQKNAILKIDKPEYPSEPNNHERYKSYHIRNISENVRYQTYAICYLINKGYNIHYDKIENKTEYDFEPYEAIKLFEKIEKKIPTKKPVTGFFNILYFRLIIYLLQKHQIFLT